MRILSLSCLVVVVSCGGRKSPASHADVCDAFEASAKTAKEFRDNARGELAEMDRDAQAWQRFEQGQFRPEEDASGELSGAKQRVFGHGRSIAVWCTASVQLRRDMGQLAWTTAIDELRRVGSPLEDGHVEKCYDALRADAESWDPRKRQDVAAKMTTWASQATQEERELVEVCRTKLGRSKPGE